MSVIVYFDSGTTNTRGFLLQNNQVIAKKRMSIGTVDNVLAQNSSTLLDAIWNLYQQLIADQNLQDNDVQDIYISGMATSVNGIYEVPYMPLPIDAQQYAQSFYRHMLPHFDREVVLLTGLVRGPDTNHLDMSNMDQLNNVRGEELELFGVMSGFSKKFDAQECAVIMPGTHTHILYVRDGTISNITSCMGGELYAAISQHTILRASVSESPHIIQQTFLESGYHMTQKHGFNRALYMTRTIDLFTNYSRVQRDSFMEGVIHTGIVIALKEMSKQIKLDTIFITGKDVYMDIFPPLLQCAGIHTPCVHAVQPMSLSVAGLLYLLEQHKRR